VIDSLAFFSVSLDSIVNKDNQNDTEHSHLSHSATAGLSNNLDTLKQQAQDCFAHYLKVKSKVST
jgi:hypothetical protein